MKKLILLGGFFLTTATFAGQLHNYNDMVSAISSGKPLRFVTNFSQCETNNKKASSSTTLIGSFTPNEIGVTDSHIATSLTHFTLNDPFFLGKPVYEFARYTITPDNRMSVTLEILDASTYTSLMDKISFNCQIDIATKIYD
ncbi:MAG: hypothetical protein ACD_45C00172G0003 [uncultured bacterium]|nr:MAG: hypothetical protein ACD_45C00172G0003 [uncultured bacterium]